MRHSRIAIAAVAAIALTACGSGGLSRSATTAPVQNAQRVVLASLVKTTAANTAKMSLDMSISGLESSAVSITADGAVDFASGDSQVTIDFGGLFGSVMPSGLEARSVDGVAYVHLPAGLAAGKDWIAIDTRKLGVTPNGGGNTALGIGGTTNPTKILAYLEKISSSVDTVGTETIRGVETTHYHANIDFAKVVNAEDVPPALHDALSQIDSMIGTVPADVWIDGNGLLRRARFEMNFASFVSGATGASGASGPGPTLTMQLDLYDFGTPVNVEAPPPDQVAHLPSLGDLGAGAGASSQGA